MGTGRGDCREEATELVPEASPRQRKTPGTWGGAGVLYLLSSQGFLIASLPQELT